MPLTESNIEDIVRKIEALGQRLAEIREVGRILIAPNLWRSGDGTLAVGTLADEEKQRLRERIRELCAESNLITAAIQTLIQ